MSLFALFAATAAGLQTGLAPLRIEGKRFVDPSGKPVALRGTNLGGWLVEEIWMTPVQKEPGSLSDLSAAYKRFASIKDNVSLWGTVEDRLGKDAMMRVRKAWRENWIQESDFKRIKDLGFNHVRIPFLYRLVDEPGGMDWLKKGVDWAKKNGLYVVLDMHGVPGGQSGEHHTGQEGQNKLWSETENIGKTELYWQRVAKEFKNEPVVAAYDLINEPMGAPNPAMLAIVYHRVITAIRKVDAKKPVIIDDGYKGFETTPHAEIGGWTQVAYSLHFYHFDAKAPEDHLAELKKKEPTIKELQGYRNAPVYIGEFNLEPKGTPQTMRDYVRDLDRAGFSWSIWTFKTVAPTGPMGMWGIYSAPGRVDPLQPFTDTEAQMIEKLKQVRTERLRIVPGLENAFRP
jgi:endoglucanase